MYLEQVDFRRCLLTTALLSWFLSMTSTLMNLKWPTCPLRWPLQTPLAFIEIMSITSPRCQKYCRGLIIRLMVVLVEEVWGLIYIKCESVFVVGASETVDQRSGSSDKRTLHHCPSLLFFWSWWWLYCLIGYLDLLTVARRFWRVWWHVIWQWWRRWSGVGRLHNHISLANPLCRFWPNFQCQFLSHPLCQRRFRTNRVDLEMYQKMIYELR